MEAFLFFLALAVALIVIVAAIVWVVIGRRDRRRARLQTTHLLYAEFQRPELVRARSLAEQVFRQNAARPSPAKNYEQLKAQLDPRAWAAVYQVRSFYDRLTMLHRYGRRLDVGLARSVFGPFFVRWSERFLADFETAAKGWRWQFKVPEILGWLRPGGASGPETTTSSDVIGEWTIDAELVDVRWPIFFEDVADFFPISGDGGTALVLSGGGSKGSFEVGALVYLQRHWTEIQPTIICGTSVGAVNALPVAESGTAGVDKLLQMYLTLRREQDMYLKEDWVVRVEEIADDIGIDPATLFDQANGAGFDLIGGSDLFLDVVLGPIGDLIGFLTTSGLQDRINELTTLLTEARNLFHLGPIETKIRDNIEFGRIADAAAIGGIKLRLVAVSLDDGQVYYVTETGRLMRGHAKSAAVDRQIDGSLEDALVQGTLASAAIPAVFRMTRISASGLAPNLVDGGVREILPMRAAVELEATHIIGIAASPNRVEPHESISGGLMTTFDDAKMPDIAMRSLNLALTEIQLNDMFPDGGHCDAIERTMIFPTFTVHGSTTVDPGLQLINIAYGWMRAFDTWRARTEGLSGIGMFAMVDSSDAIISLRKRIWELEEECSYLPPQSTWPFQPSGDFDVNLFRVFDHDKLAEIRLKKQELWAAINARYTSFAAESLPVDFSNPDISTSAPGAIAGRELLNTMTYNVDSATLGSGVYVGYTNTIFDWTDTWERHKEPLESFLRAINLWSPLPISLGTGTSPVLESNIVYQRPIWELANPAMFNDLRSRLSFPV